MKSKILQTTHQSGHSSLWTKQHVRQWSNKRNELCQRDGGAVCECWRRVFVSHLNNATVALHEEKSRSKTQRDKDFDGMIGIDQYLNEHRRSCCGEDSLGCEVHGDSWDSNKHSKRRTRSSITSFIPMAAVKSAQSITSRCSFMTVDEVDSVLSEGSKYLVNPLKWMHCQNHR